MILRSLFALATLFVLSAGTARAAVTFEALAGFGGPDGWLSPAEAPAALGTASLQRGLAYNPIANEVYVVDRNAGAFIRRLNADTGAFLGNLAAPTAGFTGGTFTVNMIAVADDGAIYVSNLAGSATTNFKVYRYADSTATPTVVFDAPTGLPRTGDSFSAIGSGVNTRIVASGSGSAGVALLTTTTGTSFSTATVNPGGAAAGSFRLGLDFLDANTIIGKQTGSGPFVIGNVNDSTATTFLPTSTGEAPLGAYGPEGLLATADINNSTIRIYDLNAPGGPSLSQSLLSLTGASVTNGNGVGNLDFGLDGQGFVRLYAMNTNNGIQAFRSVTAIPEPGSLIALSVVGAGIVARRRKVKVRP